MTKERLAYLLDKYLDDTASPEELEEYTAWYEQVGAGEEVLFDRAGTPAAMQYKQTLFQAIEEGLRPAALGQKGEGGRRIGEDAKWKVWIGGIRRIGVAGRWMAAASLLLVVVGGWLFRSSAVGPQQQRVAAAVVKEQAAVPSGDSMVRLLNNTTAIRDIRLKDGSTVRLFANSELHFTTAFGESDRKIYLSGKATFEVAKDKVHPFTVYSHTIFTTALGTSFTVTAYPGADRVEVLLHTGKVVVRQAPDQGLAKMKPVYLLPGQEVDYRIAEGLATLRAPLRVETPVKPVIPDYGSRTGWAAVFEQAGLATVLDSIGTGYRVSLEFDSASLSDVLFSGRIREKDSLSQVLQRIALLHDLEIKPNIRGFSIRKNH